MNVTYRRLVTAGLIFLGIQFLVIPASSLSMKSRGGNDNIHTRSIDKTKQEQRITLPEQQVENDDNLRANNNDEPHGPHSYKLSVPLINAKPKPTGISETFLELWNDPRPVTSLLSNSDRSSVGSIVRESNGGKNENGNNNNSIEVESIPYCIVSDVFEVETERFQILLYPKGFTSSETSESATLDESKDGVAGTTISGPASVYLRYLPKSYGDEVDITWRLKLIDTGTSPSQTLKIRTSGGLPRSNTTFSCGMTFCAENEAIESVGRSNDWGSSTWFASEVCSALGTLRADVDITIFEKRSGESSFAWPIGGALGAVQNGVFESSPGRGNKQRDFRVGEVIVPVKVDEDLELNKKLLSKFIYPGVDYRIMTMTDGDGKAIFSTKSLPRQEREFARLALRPCGWKLQHQLWQKEGMKTDWPVEVDAGLLSSNALTRFNIGSTLPRISSAFKRDWRTYTLALLLAISPIPLALLARNVVSLYAIPSASMEPTFRRGDVLLVEKFPRIYDRTEKGDVILFRPPQALRDIISMNGGSPISSTSLFVKRVVGKPGDVDIQMDESTKDVTINGEPSEGPDRNLCDDEPLKLIDRLLINGKGTNIEKLGPNDVYVLGDCKDVSVDSRVFGVLNKDNIVGKPVGRIWPPNRISSAPF